MGILQARILEWVAMPSLRDLPNPGIEARSPALQADSSPSESPGKASWKVDRAKIIKGQKLEVSWSLDLKKHLLLLPLPFHNVSEITLTERTEVLGGR